MTTLVPKSKSKLLDLSQIAVGFLCAVYCSETAYLCGVLHPMDQ